MWTFSIIPLSSCKRRKDKGILDLSRLLTDEQDVKLQLRLLSSSFAEVCP